MLENHSLHHKRQGALSMLFAVFIFCLVNALAKNTLANYHPLEILFFRFLGALIPACFLLKREGGFSNFKQSSYGISFLASIILVIDLLSLFMSYKYLPFADATVFSFSSIFFVTFLSAIFLKEPLPLSRIGIIIFGFIGIVIIAKPTGNISLLGVMFSLIFALTDAIVLLIIRVLTRTHKSGFLVFSFTLFATFITALFLPFVWKTPSGIDFCKLLCLGIGGGIGQFFITQAYKLAPASIVAPMVYFATLWSALIGFIFWNEVPPLTFWVGSTFIVFSGLYIIWREPS